MPRLTGTRMWRFGVLYVRNIYRDALLATSMSSVLRFFIQSYKSDYGDFIPVRQWIPVCIKPGCMYVLRTCTAYVQPVAPTPSRIIHRHYHQPINRWDYQLPSFRSYKTKNTLVSIDRNVHYIPSPSLLVTPANLKKVIRIVHQLPEGNTLALAFILMFHTFYHQSNFAAGTSAGFDPTRQFFFCLRRTSLHHTNPPPQYQLSPEAYSARMRCSLHYWESAPPKVHLISTCSCFSLMWCDYFMVPQKQDVWFAVVES